MEITMKENGLMIQQMVMELIFMQMEILTRGTGKMINSMVMGQKFGLILRNMKEIIILVKRMGEESTPGLMEVIMKENGI